MCTLSINNELKGIELVFESKPAKEILTAIKAAGFRWHNLKKLWYAKQTPERMELAEKLAGGNVTETAVVVPVATESVSKYDVKVGDILTGSFGYNMTIAEIYKVSKIVSAHYIEIVEIGRTLVDSDRGGSEYFMPDSDRVIGEPIKKKIIPNKYSNDGSWYVKLNESCNLYKWSGSKIYQNTWD